MANNFFAKLQQGLTKTRDNIARGFDNVFSGFSSIDEDFYEELEETLIMADIGVNATSRVMDELRRQVKEKHISEPNACRNLLNEILRKQMSTDEHAYDFEDKKTIIFVIGVNGVGKTTSVGKLASIFKNKGKKVLIAAADTYRAAATEQLAEWAKRADTPLIAGKEGADPASVIYDAASSFKARGCDILIVDTAGRLHNKKNLMDELAKMNRIIDKELPGIWRENFIVLDGTTGQNAIMQAREFGEAADLTGIVLTKLDGTAKGGIAVAIVSELNIPVKYVGVGEGIDDLERFNSDEFVDALM
ncbi:MAG: signal recognition particle-docking protein FtsY [Butyrivibrio sp.]|uniref:signal recognition particle-docking protein FtsY n=1 Tax=Butyrivibrio sp. TaxID=28121 RepID=UPI001B1F367F|nr:signal recognition particle-docking protein FtsY [Butyrivibrio sp.]MBO6239907.1 signal recognition particle-docking protein FtsY [Butyrivibrio sp.]